MSSNHYRSLVRGHQQRIARLREAHSRKIHEAAKHGEAARKAAVDATRAQSAATAKTKQQQAQRYDGQRAKAETDAAKIVANINREMVRLTADQQRLDKSLERDQINEARKLKAEVDSHWAVQAEDILQALDESEPAVIHFSGHGTAGGHLVVETPTGEPHVMLRAHSRRNRHGWRYRQCGSKRLRGAILRVDRFRTGRSRSI